MRPYIGQGIPTYTIFSTMGLFFMMMVIYLRNKIFDFLEYLEFITILAIGAGIGSKVLFIITQIPDIVEHFSLRYMCYKVVTSGFVFYGGLIGAIEGTILFAHIKQLPKKEVLQLATPGYSIFHAVGRIGCFFAGCCYGKVTSWGFALWNEPGVKRIPVQLIEIKAFVILVIIVMIQMTMDLYTSVMPKHLSDEMGKLDNELDKISRSGEDLIDSRYKKETKKDILDFPGNTVAV